MLDGEGDEVDGDGEGDEVMMDILDVVDGGDGVVDDRAKRRVYERVPGMC